MNEKEILKLLPEKAKQIFLDISKERVLGASNHIRMIGQIFSLTAENDYQKYRCPKATLSKIEKVADYMILHRGQASQAVRNGVDEMMEKIHLLPVSMTGCDYFQAIQKEVKDFTQKNVNSIDKIMIYAKQELANKKNLMLFDYSSTVEKYLNRLEETEEMCLYIPESRCIDGGHQYAKTAVNREIKVRFFPDAAILYFLKQCDAVLIGAETFYTDGTAMNTTGSDLLGPLCTYARVPLYVLTPLIKVDKRNVKTNQKKPLMRDLSELYSQKFRKEILCCIDFKCPELLPVEAEYISAFITEEGVLSPKSIQTVIK